MGYKSKFPKPSVSLTCLKKLVYHTLVSILAILLVPLFPSFLLLFFLPMWITRQSVKLLVRVFRQDLCEMATCATATCANANGSEENPRMVSLVELLFEEKLDFEQVLIEFNTRAVEKVVDNGKLLQYPELRQYPTSWLGFWFWKWDKAFHIKNHMKLYTPEKEFVTLEDLRRLEEQLLSKPFEKNRSPWEIFVIPNTRLPPVPDSAQLGSDFLPDLSTAVIVRCSHILADGYSVKKLLENVSTVKVSPNLKINYPSKSLCQQLTFPFKFYYTMAEVQILSLMKFPFKIKDGKKAKKDCLVTSDVISVKTIRNIKNRCGVSFISVIISIVTGVLRKFAERQQNAILTDTIPCAIPLPKPGHPNKLTNHFTLAVMSLPIGEANPFKRVKACHQEMVALKSSAFPAAAASFMTVFGSCFSSIGKMMGVNNFSAVNISYLPSGLEKISFLGVEILGQTFCMGVQSGSIGAVITVSSFKDRIQMHAIVDANVMPEDAVMDFKAIVNDEVSALTGINSECVEVV